MRNAIPTIYACGSMGGLTVEQAETWRLELADKLFPEIMVFSPMRDKFLTCEPGHIIEESYLSTPLSTDKGIVGRDRNDLKSSDLVFVNLSYGEQVSIGSMIEIGWADAWRIPIVLYIDELSKTQLKMYDHPFIRELTSFVVYDFDGAIELVRSILLE